MENLEQPKKNEYFNYNLQFKGEGADYFGILIVNFLLSILTLGLYYPWAKERQLKYLYNTTFLNDHAFVFSGTGSEMFKGYIKAIGYFLLLYIGTVVLIYFQHPILSTLLFYVGIVSIIPFAIHGSYRYRMSRTTWRGIRLGYRGHRTIFVLNFYKWIFLTILTLGLYSSWMTINMRNYVLSNVRFGSLQFEYDEDGADYFLINLKGLAFTLLTFGIYYFWWYKEKYEFYVNNLKLKNDKHTVNLFSMASSIDIFKLLITNLLIIVFTFGLGYAWVVTRTLSFIFNNIRIDGYVDIDEMQQTEEEYNDAMGEDIGDMLDLGFIV